MTDKKKDSKLNKWIVFTTMPFQMGVTIYVFFLLGDWLDEKYNVEGGWWTKGFTMLGVIASLYQFIRQANRISKND
ncbi:putative F0F1-ATPase subunit (Ca2+/Mg2+ transporter) [Sphingobacterium alimentarium]|uniref:Putative F0F1-ATPase subunit (Ca2+/Mg2+ transporter) n=1 Tax=Sphingobacterium alimentarium TaxID=797292 RepID=A0A4R3VRW1_9SPHI|nr:AtpZ/AtpI family protein [Sphingobacterium alimentarium]TCV11033.1 putative F0F1-ATPase subunit (Ca2+/Mg2+ transporter) [Sphingobacterium alimentarium]